MISASCARAVTHGAAFLVKGKHFARGGCGGRGRSRFSGRGSGFSGGGLRGGLACQIECADFGDARIDAPGPFAAARETAIAAGSGLGQAKERQRHDGGNDGP